MYGKKNCVPIKAYFELTPLCNFNCPMCYVHLSKEDQEKQGKLIPAEQWLEYGRQAKELGVLSIVLTGGEALTRPDFWEIYSGLNEMGFLIHVFSNGYLIDESVIEKFNEYGAPFSVKLSIYGSCNETYEKVCGVKNGYDRIMKAIDLLNNEKIPFSVTGLVIKENMEDLSSLYKVAEEKNYSFKHTIAVSDTKRGTKNNPRGSRLFISDFDNELTLESLDKLRHPRFANPYDICGSYRRVFWILWNNKMVGCSFSSKPSVNLTNTSLSDAWAELYKLQTEYTEPEKCAKCKFAEFCNKCPGVLSAETNENNEINTEYCINAEMLYRKYVMLKRDDYE